MCLFQQVYDELQMKAQCATDQGGDQIGLRHVVAEQEHSET